MNLKTKTSLPLTITPSRVDDGSHCYRRHVGRDLLCQMPYDRDEAALAFGTVLHAGAAVWWQTRDMDAVLPELERVYSEQAFRIGNYSFEFAQGLMWAYSQEALLGAGHPLAAAEGWHLFKCEERVELPLGLHRLSFKIDRIAFYDGSPPQYVLVDLKSAARITTWWRRQWPLSLQAKLYKWAASRAYDIEIHDVFIEGLLKKLPSMIENFQCPDWSASELDEAVTLAFRMVAKDAELAKIFKWDQDTALEYALTQTDFNPGYCHAYNVECPYYRLCTRPCEERARVLQDEYEYVEPSYLE